MGANMSLIYVVLILGYFVPTAFGLLLLPFLPQSSRLAVVVDKWYRSTALLVVGITVLPLGAMMLLSMFLLELIVGIFTKSPPDGQKG